MDSTSTNIWPQVLLATPRPSDHTSQWDPGILSSDQLIHSTDMSSAVVLDKAQKMADFCLKKEDGENSASWFTSQMPEMAEAEPGPRPGARSLMGVSCKGGGSPAPCSLHSRVCIHEQLGQGLKLEQQLEHCSVGHDHLHHKAKRLFPWDGRFCYRNL